MRTRIASAAAALLLAASMLGGFTTMSAAAATPVTLTIPARTYTVGTTRGQEPLTQPISQFAITIDCSPWTSPATTDVEFGVQISFDGGATWQEVTHTDEVTPAPWTIPAKYGGGTTSTATINATYATPISPTNIAGFVTVAGHSVPLGQIVVTVQ